MNTTFQEYISDKIRNPKHVSIVEKDLVSAVDKFNLSGGVSLMYINEDNITLYGCFVNIKTQPSKISIRSIGDETPHNLKILLKADKRAKTERDSLFSLEAGTGKLLFDDYFSNYCSLDALLGCLRDIFTQIDLLQANTLIVKSLFYQDIPLRYILESMTSNTIFIDSNSTDVSVKGRIDIHPLLLKNAVGIVFPLDTIKGVMLNKNEIYVPLDSITLNSTFYGRMIWRDLLGELSVSSENDVLIDDVSCRLIRLTPHIDGYGNLFITINSILDRESITRLIDGPGLSHLSAKQIPEMVRETVARPISVPPHQEKQLRKQNTVSTVPKSPAKGPQSKSLPSGNDSLVFDGVIIPLKSIEINLQKMKKEEIKKHLSMLNKIFEKMTSGERIVTDTNLWISEYPKTSKQMAYRKLIEYMYSLMDANKGQVFELNKNVYDEIAKLADNDVAASKEAKRLLLDYLSLKCAEFPEIELVRKQRAYADEPIGHRINQLYSEKKKFSILTNDTDAMVRWVASLRNIEKSLEEPECGSFPPYILCRDLQRVFLLRGKLIRQLKTFQI